MILACFQMSAPIFFCRGRSLLQDPEPSYRFYDCLFHNPGATSFGPAEKAAGSTEPLCPSDRRQSQGGQEESMAALVGNGVYSLIGTRHGRLEGLVTIRARAHKMILIL